MEPTTTLADALLDDLNDLMDSDEEPEVPASSSNINEADDDDDDGAEKMPAASGADALVKTESSVSNPNIHSSSALQTSQFLNNVPLQKHLTKVKTLESDKQYLVLSKKEREEEDHQLVVQSNKFLANVADEMARAHGELTLAYKPKFPELEELLPNYIQYKNAVRIIWNQMDLTEVNDELNQILNSNQIITISVAGSTTSGRALSDEELQRVDMAATYIEQLVQVQNKLIEFVENSMEALAPSICSLIGASTAARLLGLVGGLAELCKIPSCNLQVIGQVKQNSTSRAGMASSSTKQHTGIIADCDLVQSCPRQLQKKALKTVAAKLALAARFDFVNVDTGRPRSARTGLQFRRELEEKFEKLQEPDRAPVLKALPK